MCREYRVYYCWCGHFGQYEYRICPFPVGCGPVAILMLRAPAIEYCPSCFMDPSKSRYEDRIQYECEHDESEDEHSSEGEGNNADEDESNEEDLGFHLQSLFMEPVEQDEPQLDEDEDIEDNENEENNNPALPEYQDFLRVLQETTDGKGDKFTEKIWSGWEQIFDAQFDGMNLKDLGAFLGYIHNEREALFLRNRLLRMYAHFVFRENHPEEREPTEKERILLLQMQTALIHDWISDGESLEHENREKRCALLLQTLKTEDLQEDERQCSICFAEFGDSESETTEQPCKTHCGHIFGGKCIQAWICHQRVTSCPMCRSKFENLSQLEGIEHSKDMFAQHEGLLESIRLILGIADPTPIGDSYSVEYLLARQEDLERSSGVAERGSRT